jgi:hypothetical protein
MWNGSMGMLVTAALGRIEDGKWGFLEAPFDFVGPLNLDELETQGRIAFGACLVMSRKRWREDQAELRREARERRRAQAKRLSLMLRRSAGDEARYRALLDLPLEGMLEPSQIKAAFRRLAKRAHPDAGGSNERFHRITEARDAVLESLQDAAP